MVKAVSMTGISDPWSAFRALHPAFEPGGGIRVGRRVCALGRIAHDIDELGLSLRLVEAVGAVGDVGDALVALADRHADGPARSRVFEALERRDHLVGGRARAALLRRRLLPRRLEAEDRL